jgi:hypothetical protein
MPFTPDPVDPTRRAELIDKLRADVPRRRARRHAFVALGAAGVVLVLVAVVVALPETDRTTVEFADAVSTTEADDATSTVDTGRSTSSVPVTTAETPPPSPPVTTIPGPDDPAATLPVITPPTVPDPDPTDCDQSYDPACGPLVYDPPAAANQPVTISMAASPEGPYQQGDVVHLTFTIDDPDAAVPADCVHVMGHHTITTMYVFTGCDRAYTCSPPVPRHGTWPPPTIVPGHIEVTYDVTLTHESESSLYVQVTALSGGSAPCSTPESEAYGSPADRSFQFSWG